MNAQQEASNTHNQLANAAQLLSDPRLCDTKDLDIDTIHRIDYHVAELTRLMEHEILGNRDRTLVIQQNLTDSGSGIYNNTVNLERPEYNANQAEDIQSGFAHINIGSIQEEVDDIIIPPADQFEPPSRIEQLDAEEEGYYTNDENDNTDNVNYLPDSREDDRNNGITLENNTEEGYTNILDKRILDTSGG